MKMVVLLLLGIAANSTLLWSAGRPAGDRSAMNAEGEPVVMQADSAQRPSTRQIESPLDYDEYRTRIEPIFLKKRQGDVSCYGCHSTLTTRLKLESLTAGSTLWNQEQSRKNFAVVSRLVNFADPLKSPLLLHPLAAEAGGDPTHAGGKFWNSKDDPEWQMLARWVSKTPPSHAVAPPVSSSKAPLSFEFFVSKVQPIFMKQRPGHARCYSCHSLSNRAFRLEKLSDASAGWTEEQSQRNFQSAAQQVVPGKPASSSLLMHPLAPEAGGDAFHSGGRQFESQDDPDWMTLAQWVRAGTTEADPSSSPEPNSWIYVTNSAADTIDVINPRTNELVQSLKAIELPHGIAFSPDGKKIYLSSEAESVLAVLDRKTGEMLRKIPLSGRPNNIAITKDGSRVIVGIRSEPGALDVIETSSLTRTKSVPLHGRVHNVYVTPDSKFAVAGSIESKMLMVADLESEQPVWDVKFDSGVRPMALEKNADGSTSRVFVQLSGFHGFAVVDFAKRAEATRIKLPDEPHGFGVAEGRTGVPSHGIGVAPDGKSLWVNSTLANAVFEYSLPDLKLIGHADLPLVHSPERLPTGAVPEWMTFTPDSKVIYISDSAAKLVTAIDTRTLKVIAHIPVGEVPKRINTLVLPASEVPSN
jgi:YVTN family beta-propeller protein